MKVCLFDCGGVLYPYSLMPFKEWLAEKTSRKSFSFKWKELMTGEIDFSLFAKDVCVQAGFNYTITAQENMKKTLLKGMGSFYPETRVLMNELKKQNIQMGLLSNALPNFEGTLEELPLTKELIFPSYRLGFLKPDKKIFKTVLEQINLPPQDILFIDDKKENVDAALSMGLRSFVFQRETVLANAKKIIGEKNVGYIGCRGCHCR